MDSPASIMPNMETIWLPKLPVPPLEQTMAAYLEAVEVTVEDEEHLAKTKELVEQFSRPDGIGPKLQDLLLDKQAKEDNWAYNWWLDDMYMNNDIPLPVNSNPGMVFPQRAVASSATSGDGFVKDVAVFINAILDYKELIDRQLLPQDRALTREKGQPFCMTQYQRLFATYRVPGLERDRQKTFPPPDDSQHVIIAHQGQFWRLEVRHRGRRLPSEEMVFNLAAIIEDGQKATTSEHQQPPIGLLTTANRRLWAQWRHQLLQDSINARSLQSIESSSLIVCIDRPLPCRFNNAASEVTHQRDDTNRAVQMIHGGGSDWNSANRWFDKTVQFIFSPDGTSGTCYEHSPAEGIVLVQVIEKALERVAEHRQRRESTSEQPPTSNDDERDTGSFEKDDGSNFPTPKKLTWKIDDAIRRAVETASIDLDRLVADLDFRVFRFNAYGKNRIKTFNVSPDVYIQLMLQWTYYKLHGKLVATYESASTRRFRLGRVDNIRSASLAALIWVRAMNDPQSSDEERVKLFYRAADNQTDVMVKNILGQGIDIHLLGLRELARKTAHPDALAVFEDPSYAVINHFSLSTSQIPTNSDSFMGYGPVVPDGYGCSYNPKPESIIFCASSFRSGETTDTNRFVVELEATLTQVAQLLHNRK